MQKRVNAKDKLCPAPLILTKQAINQCEKGCEIVVECNNETAKNNILTYLKELGISAQHQQNGDIYTITFLNPDKINNKLSAESFCSTKKKRTIVIKSELMGDGDPVLGSMLMRAFINALPEADEQPDNIVIYNSGVQVILKERDTAITLKRMEDAGVKITVCGTCIDFYGVKEQLNAGTIGNMYKITEILNNSDTVVYP